MPAIRRRGYNPRRVTRRPVQWFDEIVTEIVASSDQQVDDISVDIPDSDKKGMTRMTTPPPGGKGG